MKNISCPWCNRPLPNETSAQECTACGKPLYSATPTTSTMLQLSETSGRDTDVSASSLFARTRSSAHRVLSALSPFSLLRKSFSFPRWWRNYQYQKQEALHFTERVAFSIPLTLDPRDEEHFTDALQDPTSEENSLSQLRPDGQRTWKRVVKPSSRRLSYIYPPRPPVPENEPVGVSISVLTTHLSPSTSTLQAFKRSTVSRMRRTSPRVAFWISVLILLLTVSAFGIPSTFGRQLTPTNKDTRLSLQITPSEVAVGATMNLRGDNFSPYASIGFRRDDTIPVMNTSDALSTQADATGHFTDTIIVGSDWGVGPHVITAEDSLTHKVASFPITVGGQGTVSRPPHLHLSVNTLDFGVGDQATNGTKSLMLLNSASSEVNWQGSTGASWLLITPTQGNFTRDIPQEITVAVDRSKLQPGSHRAVVRFSSNAGNESLNVSMQVTSLKPEHRAVMQVSPGVLSFTANDGNNPTSSQSVKVSNSGGQAMNWFASASVPWLTVSPPSLTVAPGSSATAQVSVASRNLLPGIYTATLTFTAQNVVGSGIVFHSPQQVVVSITVTPPCALLLGPAMLDFSSAYLQPAPAAKKVNIIASSGCGGVALNWNVSSNVPWLRLNTTSGTTPGALSVGVDVTGLSPKTYTGTITVSSRISTQTVVVRFILGSPTLPLLVATPSSINIGVPGTTVSPITVANAGGSALNWSAALQGDAPAFVSLSAASGSTLVAGAKATFTVVVNAKGVESGTYRTSVVIQAKNAANGQPVTGAPATIPITITIASPAMQVSKTKISLSANTGYAVNPQSLTITNTAGGILSWTVTYPTQSWLSISTTEGTTPMGSSSTLVFSIQTDGLTASNTAYTDYVTITPSDGNSVTIDISLKITNKVSKAVSTASVTPTVTWHRYVSP